MKRSIDIYPGSDGLRNLPVSLSALSTLQIWRITALLLLSVVLCGCSREPQTSGPKYGDAVNSRAGQTCQLAVHPLHNPQKLIDTYRPLAAYLNKHLKYAKLEIEPSRNYNHYEEKIRSRTPHFLLPNPWQTLEAIKAGYTVVAMAGRPEDFKGIFLVRRDSGIRKPSDLKGKAVSYPSPTAVAACIMPQYFLHKQGIDVNTEITNIYVGSQESAIMNAYIGQTAAGATWPPPWRLFQKDHPREASELRVAWETPHLLNNSFMVRDDVPAQIREQVRTLLLQLHTTEEGRQILAGMETDQFLPANDADYDAVRRYIAQFEREVRPVLGNK